VKSRTDSDRVVYDKARFGSQKIIFLAVVPEGLLVILVLCVLIRVQDPDIAFVDQVAQGLAQFGIGQ
jgi:hypothetical protein